MAAIVTSVVGLVRRVMMNENKFPPDERNKMELDDMYRGKCPDGDRCLHGCHTSERCFYAKDAEGRKLDEQATGPKGCNNPMCESPNDGPCWHCEKAMGA